MSDKSITREDIQKALQDGRLPNLILYNHYSEISTCEHILDQTLDKLSNMDFKPHEIYYAYVRHLYFFRFGLEDAGMEEMMKAVDAEAIKLALEHRKRMPKDRPNKEDDLKMLKDAEQHGTIEP